MSPTHFVFGAWAVKPRPIRSGALAAAGPGTVVRCRRRNRTPSIPDARMIHVGPLVVDRLTILLAVLLEAP